MCKALKKIKNKENYLDTSQYQQEPLCCFLIITLKFPGIRAASKLEFIFKSENMFKAHRKQPAIYLCCPEFGKSASY